MDIRRLRYFIALAEELHFRRAAARLAISQPPLSMAIKQLEEEMGTPLFERNTKMVALTAAGAAFYPEALKVLAQLDLARTVTRRVAAGEKGVLRLGFVGGMLMRRMPEVVQDYIAEHPGVAIFLQEQSSTAQVRSIMSGHLSGGFLHLGHSATELDILPICDEPFVCCVGASSRLARGKTVDLFQLRNEQFVMFARDISPGYYDTVLSMCARAGFSPDIRYDVTHWMTAVALVSKGIGVALVPQSFEELGIGGVHFTRLRDETTRSIAHFAWNRRTADPALTTFVRFLADRTSAPKA